MSVAFPQSQLPCRFQLILLRNQIYLMGISHEMVLKSVLFLCRIEGILKIQNLSCSNLRDWAVKWQMKSPIDKCINEVYGRKATLALHTKCQHVN